MPPSSNAEWKTAIEDIAQRLDAIKPQPEISSSTLSEKSLAKTIDHTLLKLDATEEQVAAICDEAIDYDFAAVCVRLNFVKHAVASLQKANAAGQGIKVACVVGFHEGNQSTQIKFTEAHLAITAGAAELDIVLNRDLLQAGSYTETFRELKALREQADKDASLMGRKTVLKLILETSQLSKDEIIGASVIAGYANFDFIKTSTGFCGRGASVEDVEVMHKIAIAVADKLGRDRMKVKASGGVRTLEDAKKMLDAGAERIGASAGVAIIQEFQGHKNTAAGSGY